MSKRQPHWDDELIEDVRSCMNTSARYGAPTDYEVHEVIAAVEDWQDARGSAIDGQEVVRAVAQVQRVRELRDRFAAHEKSISYQAAATLLTRALGGPDE